MPPSDHDNRRVEIYFGPSRYTGLTKEEVADFIEGEMGLIRSDGGPKWTEALTSLIRIGMENWDDSSVVDQDELRHLISGLKNQISEYQEEVLELCPDDETNQVDLLRAVDEVHRIEARILKELCKDKNIGAKSPNYIDVHSLANEVGIEYPVLYEFLLNLSNEPTGTFVQFDLMGERVKAAKNTVFETYCEARSIDTSSI